MRMNEIRIGGIYRASLNVQLRSEKEVKEFDFFIRIVGKTEQGNVEFCFLNDNQLAYLEPRQVTAIE